jgi:hypothetical protein
LGAIFIGNPVACPNGRIATNQRIDTSPIREERNGSPLHWPHRRLLRIFGGIDPFLREPDGQAGPPMNWVYGLSAAAALVIFVYLVVTLFKPELFE